MRTLLLFKIAFFIAFMFSQTIAHAQSCIPGNNRYMNNWYFGSGAGINFNSGGPTVLTDGKINQREGCASISDNAGNLLFYTDGRTIYNKNHSVMINGENLNGHTSSTQSAIILPMPRSTSKYYVFTCGIMLESEGIQYSIVDMNLKGGEGAVIASQKNIPIYQNPNPLNRGTVEKLAATYHENNSDIWLIFHQFNNKSFISQLITDKGISPPVTSVIDPVIGSNWDATGYMKFSPNSKKLATSLGNTRIILMLDFNNQTGKLTNANHIVLPPGYNYSYGVEFSPNNNYLYVSTMNSSALNTTAALLQYNLTLSSYFNISINPFPIPISSANNYGALQIGPDGRIYVAKESGVNIGNQFLGVIENPNEFVLNRLNSWTSLAA